VRAEFDHNDCRLLLRLYAKSPRAFVTTVQ